MIDLNEVSDTSPIRMEECTFFPVILRPRGVAESPENCPSPAFSPVPPWDCSSTLSMQCAPRISDEEVVFEEEPMPAAKSLVSAPPKWVLCYVIRFDSPPGKFDPDKAKKLGVRPGPAFGQLQRGECIQLANGAVVRPDDVMSPRQPGPVAAVIDCPSLDYLPSLLTNEALPQLLHQDSRSPDIVVHNVPVHIFELPEYQAWMKRVAPSATHIVANDSYCSASERFMSAANQQVRLFLFCYRCALH